MGWNRLIRAWPESSAAPLPSGGPYVVENQAYVETSSSGILVNNFNEVSYFPVPFETTSNFYFNPVSVLTLVTDPLPDGVYTVTVSFCYGSSSTNNSFVGGAFIDGSSVDIKEFRAEVKDVEDSPYTSFQAPLIVNDGLNASKTIDLAIGRSRLIGSAVARLWYANIRIASEV